MLLQKRPSESSLSKIKIGSDIYLSRFCLNRLNLPLSASFSSFSPPTVPTLTCIKAGTQFLSIIAPTLQKAHQQQQ
jgi:hypothetical protein